MAGNKDFQLACPLPPPAGDRIQLAHGGGGRLTRQLIEQIFLPAFSGLELDARHDGAVLPFEGARLAFTTDSFVVDPPVFPGGTIGDLAINGTVNDLAMCGAEPLHLSAAFILEEGFPVDTLRTVAESMRLAATRAGVGIVTGDTKVVDRGKGGGVFISTSGIGVVRTPSAVDPRRVTPGDAVLLSGDIGSHSVAILSVRGGLEFDSPVTSDTVSLWPAVDALIRAGIEIHCLRDATRGGVATALNEIASTAGISITVNESEVPVTEPVRGASEILGLDPLYMANEGRFLAIVPQSDGARALETLRGIGVSSGARMIGRVTEGGRPRVTLRSPIGGMRVLDMLSGEQLPRIC
ncbi:MAG: hydrogenase expression/formation protein HypE [Bryobacterales bacterium]|nr:hydrogenase expression/formation protein HypE [Bryobacterales bacterium]